jgi:hypothetical protein
LTKQLTTVRGETVVKVNTKFTKIRLIVKQNINPVTWRKL